MSTNVETTNIVPTGFAALADFRSEELEENFAGLSFTPDRIKIPAGGGTVFEVPGDEDDNDVVKDLHCVILFHHPMYAFYEGKYQGGNELPQCSSFDGVHGIGKPGGLCASCPYNNFGTAAEGSGKACRNKRSLYLIREGEMFPQVLTLPTGSLKEFSKYLKRQMSKGRKLAGVVTKISLKKATSSTGITYSQAVFAFDRVLTAEEVAALAPIIDSVKAYAADLPNRSFAQTEDGGICDADTGEVIAAL